MLRWAALLGFIACAGFVACSGFSSEEATSSGDAAVDSSADPDAADAEDSGAATRKRMFVTSDTFNGNFSDFDGKCKAAADRAGLGGTWVAWISVGTSASGSARAKFMPGQGPWYAVGDPIRKVFDLFPSDGGEFLPLVAPTHDETGQIANDGGRGVWTATKATGSGIASHCSGWTSADASDDGRAGDFSLTSEFWTNKITGTRCNTFNHLYCFEQ